jgi:hypothetical protein
MASRFETTYRDRVVPAANRAFGTTVTLVRGSETTEPFTARRGDRDYQSIGQEFGIEVTILMRDFLLPVDALFFGSDLMTRDPATPRTGDRIVDGDEVFEIQPPDESRPSVELRPGAFEYLVHTKKIKVVT